MQVKFNEWCVFIAPHQKEWEKHLKLHRNHETFEWVWLNSSCISMLHRHIARWLGDKFVIYWICRLILNFVVCSI